MPSSSHSSWLTTRSVTPVAAEPTRERVCIRQKHVEEAFQTTRPSNSPASLSEREAAFTRFASGEEAVKAAGQMPLFAQRIVHA